MAAEPIAADIPPPAPPARERFFSPLDWLAFGVTFLVSFAVFVATVAPTVTLEDSGEMAVACDYRGVPHPPGYPLWTFLGWIFTRILRFVHYRGQPNPAWAVAVMSGFFGALAAGLIAMLVSRLSAKFILRNQTEPDAAPSPRPSVLPAVGGIVAGLLLAFAPVAWSQSVIVEVYSMNAFLVLLQLLVACMWMERPTNRMLYFLAFLFGVGLSHYFYASFVSIVILVAVIWMRERHLFWDATAVVSLLGGIAILFKDAFPEAGGALTAYFQGFASYLTSPTGASEITSEMYASTLGGVVLLALGLIACAVIQARFRQMRSWERFLIQAVIAVLCLGIATPLLAKSYRLSVGTQLTADTVSDKVGLFLSGLVLAFLAPLAWFAQRQLFPNWKRPYLLAILPTLFLLCLLAAGSRFFDADQLGRAVAPDASPAAVLNMPNRSLHYFWGCVLLTAPMVIWIALGRVFGEWKRVFLMGALAGGAWIVIHLYLPWASESNPPMNWGYPRTPQGFKHAVFRGQYQKVEPCPLGSPESVTLTFQYFRMLFGEFTVPVALLGLFPFCLWRIRLGPHRIRGTTVASLLLLLAAAVYIPVQIRKNFYGAPSPSFDVVYVAIMALVWVLGLAGLISLLVSHAAVPGPVGLLLEWAGSLFRRLMRQPADSIAALRLGVVTAISGFLGLVAKTLSPETIRWFVTVVAFPTLPDVLTALDPGKVPKPILEALRNKEMTTDVFQQILSLMTGISVSASYGCESLTQILTFARHAALLGLALVFAVCFAVLARWLIRWLWSRRCDAFQCWCFIFSTIPAVAVFYLLSRLAPVSVPQCLSFLDAPLARQHVVGTWEVAPDAFAALEGLTGPALEQKLAGAPKVFHLGVLPALIVSFLVVGYLLACILMVLRRWSESAEESAADPDLGCDWIPDREFREWLTVGLYTFLGWGLVFAVFAWIKPDLQDTFIQRVKFYASHAVYALWVGYGLVAVCALALRRGFRNRDRLVRGACAGLLLVLPAVPVLNNFYNKKLVREMGSAELTGHDFGWQFGNYQLRGADAITEELSPDEEPLPNPSFPREMETNAVFYGGTDPGRFVPTYMIYSARVREDVDLITQNALADNTYMNVMRDLYGDRIWIPAQFDSAKAFQRYVEEVNSGKRPRNAQLTVENGRVQVSGALGVMEINGILAQMIFEHNNFRHAFYVEESYVIQWMYPYLTPHGLIMKINRTTVPIAPENVRDDLNLWDWYCRRLLSNAGFRRDVCARKSFSKLRSAIAGLYAARGMLGEGELAFKEARFLYPLSPEANLRLVQEVILRTGRFGDAKDVIAEYARMDPGNGRAADFLREIARVEKLNQDLNDMERRLREGKLDFRGALDLADKYLQAGQAGRFENLLNSLLANTNMPAPAVYNIAKLWQRAGRHAEAFRTVQTCVGRMPRDTPKDIYLDMVQMLMRGRDTGGMIACYANYLRLQPDDWKAWLDVALLLVETKQNAEATRALQQALRYGGREAEAMIRRDRRFEGVRGSLRPAVPRPNLLGIPESRMPSPLAP